MQQPIFKRVPRGPFAPWFFTLSIILLFLIMTFPFFSTLTIFEGTSNKILYQDNMKKGDSFSIFYIHSIHLTPVEEFYFMDDDLDLVLSSVAFDTYGVGMPSELNPGEELDLKDGKIIIKNMNREFSELDLRIGQVIANHQLRINNEIITLADIASPGAHIKIKILKTNLFSKLIYRD